MLVTIEDIKLLGGFVSATEVFGICIINMDKQTETSYFNMKENSGGLSLFMLFTIVTFICDVMLFFLNGLLFMEIPLEVRGTRVCVFMSTVCVCVSRQ